MGDRRNVVIHYGDREVYLYTHSDGYRLPATVAVALKRGETRWTDDVYLARIIFCEMVRGDVTGMTGYGISPFLTDTNYPGQEVEVYPARGEVSIGDKVWTFDQFVEEFSAKRDMEV